MAEVKKQRATDIVLKLKVMEGKFATNSGGVIDKRLFDGSNNLHAIQDRQTTLWHVIYDHGANPQVFKQRFTDFNTLYDFVSRYYAKRNIEIAEIID